ncbi:MAG TPA: carbohydrate ABC transporter permease [bacterium]|nr:carbohydrate ABC transporter permease [bacterium]HPO10156.1 carbohydrate ABC transporter permease [bacterium]HQO35816.1 carbohydrate ABC transporter permease [bacterium]
MNLHTAWKKRLAGFGTVGLWGVVVFAACLTLMPFVWLLCASVKTTDDFFVYNFLPHRENAWWDILWNRLTLDNFRRLETELGFHRYAINSVFVSTAQTCLVVLFSSMGGYALAKYRFRGMHVVATLMLVSMMIPGEVLLGPMYELLYRIGWLDTYLGLIIPGSVSVFAMFLYRQSMLGVPNDLLDAARVDGCSEFGIYAEIVMRACKPMTGAIVLLTFLGSWNAFLWPQIILQTDAKYTLPVVLAQLITLYWQDYALVMAGTLVSVVPVMVLFFALQREFVGGLVSGALKG